MNWGATIFLALGVIFGVIGNLGVLILPDVYTRLQASSTASTTSVFSALIAGVFVVGWDPMAGKIAVIALFFFVSSPIAAHIIARYAWQREIVPWRRSYAERRVLQDVDDD
jgi:multicomponent Na+:H+ antiporter subunit G